MVYNYYIKKVIKGILMRRSGILMPVFSLASPYGIGTMGEKAFEFVRFLKRAGQSFWQILPLMPIDYSGSPYQSKSSFAGNSLLIDLDELVKDGLLDLSDINEFSFDNSKLDFSNVIKSREVLLNRAFSKFDKENSDFKEFVKKTHWLLSYACFSALKDAHENKPFYEWEEKYKNYSRQTLEQTLREYPERVLYYEFEQFEFYKQWSKLKNFANSLGIKIIGDIPIYVALDSADVWSDPKQFDLNSELRPEHVAGVSPDVFSKNGQLWGNPLYNWEKAENEKEPFSWWKKRLKAAFELYDTVRIDHFRAFESYYAIKSSEKTAIGGVWKKGPGIKFFDEMKKEFSGKLPLIAEDLGIIDDKVRALLKQTGLPGMKVLQFGFDDGPKSEHILHNHIKNCVCYIGTHDNDTVIGWKNSKSQSELKFIYDYIGFGEKEGFNIAMIRTAMSSVADTVIITLSDLMGLSSEGRINTPGTIGNNWCFRIADGCVNDWLADILLDITSTYGRNSN